MRRVRQVCPIMAGKVPVPHLRIMAQAFLRDHLADLGVVAVADPSVRVDSRARQIITEVDVRPVEARPSQEASLVCRCPNCDAVLARGEAAWEPLSGDRSALECVDELAAAFAVLVGWVDAYRLVNAAITCGWRPSVGVADGQEAPSEQSA